jgi:putative ABC transport system ATP-binding protein
MTTPELAEPSAATNLRAEADFVLEAVSLYRFFRAGDEETLALRGVSVALSPG